MSDVPRPLKQEMPRYREVEEQLLQVIYKEFLGSSLTDEEAQRLKEIDDDLLWYDLEVLLEEKQPGDAPKLHFELDYTVRPFVEDRAGISGNVSKTERIIKDRFLPGECGIIMQKYEGWQIQKQTSDRFYGRNYT